MKAESLDLRNLETLEAIVVAADQRIEETIAEGCMRAPATNDRWVQAYEQLCHGAQALSSLERRRDAREAREAMDQSLQPGEKP